MPATAINYYRTYAQIESSSHSILNHFNFNDCRVIDVGCGVGESLFYLGGNYRLTEAIGLDSSELSIEYAREKNTFKNITFRCASISTAELPTACFQYVISFGMLHYYPKPEALNTLRKMANALCDEGRIVLFMFKPHPVHSFRKLVQYVLTSTRLVKLIESMEDATKRNVVMNILNPPAFYPYSVSEISEMASKLAMDVEEVIAKPIHTWRYFFPNGQPWQKFADVVLKWDALKKVSVGNYYVLRKRFDTPAV